MDSSRPGQRTVSVTILQETFTLRTRLPEEKVQQLAASVDELLTRIAARSPDLSPTRVAVLGCLELASRLRALEEQLEALQQQIESRSRDFADLLDRAIETSPADSPAGPPSGEEPPGSE